MFLFKKSILECYNVMNYTEDGFLLLHCSRNDVVYAPFDGKVEGTQNGCILYNNEFQLYLCHMVCDKEQEVNAGAEIGIPLVTRNMAYIGIKLIKNNECQDILTYLEHRDKTYKKVKVENTEVGTQEEVKPKPKKKSTNKKKK